MKKPLVLAAAFLTLSVGANARSIFCPMYANFECDPCVGLDYICLPPMFKSRGHEFDREINRPEPRTADVNIKSLVTEAQREAAEETEKLVKHLQNKGWHVSVSHTRNDGHGGKTEVRGGYSSDKNKSLSQEEIDEKIQEAMEMEQKGWHVRVRHSGTDSQGNQTDVEVEWNDKSRNEREPREETTIEVHFTWEF